MEIEAIKKALLQQIEKNGISEKEYLQLGKDGKSYLQKRGEKYFLKIEFRKLISVAMTGGVFDIIHPGHILTLSEAKKQADLLIVAIATDETVKKTKKREPMHRQPERVQMANSLKPVDLAIAGGADWRQTLQQVSPDIVIFGYDQEEKKIEGIQTIKLDIFSSSEHSKTGKVREKLGF
ncbi:hypothetical protein COU37_04600 [Candidatus Micrarchaeota archaeon CG10_big_fil_rev_8_21_14_0_10_45_29]|nr:MAG: hypothetical protein COU37_04600 [Candidatus Micrarchaeota archaeon CG10_big_fil_rev_8_21_14_0_10_45_29]